MTEDETRKDRGETYGCFVRNHSTIARTWQAMLEQHWQMDLPDLPPEMVALMMATVKINRLCKTLGHEDSTHDGKIYLQLAQDIAVTSKNSSPPVKEQDEDYPVEEMRAASADPQDSSWSSKP